MSDVHPDESQEDRDRFDQMMRRHLYESRAFRPVLEFGLSKVQGDADLVALHEQALATNAETIAKTESYLETRP